MTMLKISTAVIILLLSFSPAYAENVSLLKVYQLANDSIVSGNYEYFGCNPPTSDSPIVIPLLPQLIQRGNTFENQIIPLTVIIVPSP